MLQFVRLTRLASLAKPHVLTRRVRFSTTPSPPPPLLSSSPPPPTNLSGHIVSYVFDHPWHIFGPLGVALIAYLIRSSIATARQEELIRALDDASPLHAREVASIGRANALSASEWRLVFTDVLNSIEEKCNAQNAAGITLNDYRTVALVKPSEIEAALTLLVPSRPLSQLYMLRRAATWLAACEAGIIAWPNNDEEANCHLKARALEAAQAEGFAEPVADGIFGTAYAIVLGIARTAGLIEPGPSLPQPGGVRPPLKSPVAIDWADAPLPVLTALSLYGTLVGGRDEWDADTPEADEIARGAPRPSERILLWADMIRAETALKIKINHLKNQTENSTIDSYPGDKNSTIDSYPGDKIDVDLLSRGSTLINNLGLSTESACTPVLTLREAAAVIQLLGRTFQLPTRARTGKLDPMSSWLSDPRYVLRPADDAVNAACLDAKIEFNKSPTPAKPPPPIGGVAPTPAKPAVSLSPSDSPRNWLSGPETRSALLNSREICAWGECTANQPEYKGGLF